MVDRLDDESLTGLVGAIYEAAFEPERWRVTLPKLVAALDGDQGFLGFTSSLRGRTFTTVSHEMDDAMLRHWQQDFAGFDPWYDRSGALGAGTVVQGLEVLPWDELRRVEVHAALFHPAGIDDLICASVANHGRSFDFVTVHRSLRRGPFEEAEVRAMRFLAPHLVRAAQVHDKLAFLSEAHDATEALLDRLPYGVLWLDASGRPLRTNREARRILASSDGLGARAGAIQASHPEAQKRLAAAIAAVAAPIRRKGGGDLLSVPRPSAARAYQLLLIPVPAPSRERVFGSSAPRVSSLLVVSDPEAAPEPAAATLRRLFGLTPAIARLAAALASGRTLAEYAEGAAVTMGTARYQLKELFARTGTNRQAELVRLLLGGIAQLDAGDEAGASRGGG
jgi:DNA-binding CsgD family transcriptional regulator